MNRNNTAAGRSEATRMLVFAGVFAALTFVVFTFFSIPIPTPGGGKVSVHLGNAFVALGALLLGSVYGAAGGAIGLTIADLLDPVYIVEAPATFLIKFAMGLLVGVIAHRLGHIDREREPGRVLRRAFPAVLAGMAFNALADPLVRYFYKILILGRPAAQVSFAINFSVTLINSLVSLAVTLVLYMAIRVPLKKAGLLTISG